MQCFVATVNVVFFCILMQVLTFMLVKASGKRHYYCDYCIKLFHIVFPIQVNDCIFNTLLCGWCRASRSFHYKNYKLPSAAHIRTHKTTVTTNHVFEIPGVSVESWKICED